MPIYEYECNKCKQTIEIVHGISENPKRKCPECGGKIKRLISLNSFHLKGTGWYKTDYANKPAQADGNGKGAEAKKDSKEGADKSDKKVKKENTESKDSKKKKDSAAVA